MRTKASFLLALAPIGVITYAAISHPESGAAPAATAAPAPRGAVTLEDLATGFCLDSNTSGNAYTMECNGGSSQKWIVIERSASVVSLKNLATGLCLDSNTSGNAYTLDCNGGNFQKWTVIERGGNTFSLRNVSTWRCLDSNTSRNLYTLGCNGGSSQSWTGKARVEPQAISLHPGI